MRTEDNVMNKVVIAAALVALTAAMLKPAAAEVYPYCAFYTDQSSNCGFSTMWSCQASVSGVGGYCGVNPRAAQRPAAYGGPSPQHPATRRTPPPASRY
jgi:Protein of unknown function (DUF3551)